MRRLRFFRYIMHCVTKPTMKKTLVALLLLSLLSIWMLAIHIASPRNINGETKENTEKHPRKYTFQSLPDSEPRNTVQQQQQLQQQPQQQVQQQQGQAVPRAVSKEQVDKVALVFLENAQSALADNITITLEANRIKYRTIVSTRADIPPLAANGVGLYAVIIFENLLSYANLHGANRDTIDQYCKLYGIGMVAFAPLKDADNSFSLQVGDFPLHIDQHLNLKELSLNPASNVYYITKSTGTIKGSLPGDDWAVFRTNHSTYQPIARAKTGSQDIVNIGRTIAPILHTTVVHDQGTLDGIQRIFFGGDFKLWLHFLLFLDSVHYLSGGLLGQVLDRYIMVDIDDIFVGSAGIRMIPEDVEALGIEQENLRELVPGFHFNLGFSGNFFLRGTDEENLGDHRILKDAHKFWWFPHMWDHSQPHIYSDEAVLKKQMLKNLQFAKDHNISVDQSYAVSPHHSGVYPVVDSLYTMWKEIWNVTVTSTEEYPHLRPARRRKGFIYNGMKVLPRQTCGLFTHTIFMAKYPGGRERLDTSILGGELFQTVINSPVNIFMTHLSNYGNDRLALYTFDKLINFLKQWTNFNLQTLPPKQLADRYFELYPEEKEPLWGNPCDDKRLTMIWQEPDYKCARIPRFIVIGPQKTGTTALYTFLQMHPHIKSNLPSPTSFELFDLSGTTALYTFLQMHPHIKSNLPSPTSFEELQFFNTNNYNKGLDWYLSFFAMHKNKSDHLFEKSAGYFDNNNAPARIHALLPKVKLVAILLDPIQRAYSWYMHQQAHKDPTSMKYSFYEVISSDSASPKLVQDLKRRCLDPGSYEKHLQRWLKYFSPHQMHLIDGAQLREDPVNAMSKVIRFLHIKPYIDYSELIQYDKKKGFYCQVLSNGRSKCLGIGKGRQYDPIDDKSRTFLLDYFQQSNKDLESLLAKLGHSSPKWLQDSLSER